MNHTRIFRQHDTAPTDVVSPLYAQLTKEWADLHTLPSTAATLRRWARTETILAGYRRPGDIVDAIDQADYDRTDELLLALIRLFQSGQQLAGRVVLQALLPKLAKTSSHAANLCTSSADTWAEDRRHLTIAEFWAVLADYPVDRRTSRVASNLALDTLHQITGARRPTADIPLDPYDLTETNHGERRADPTSWLTATHTSEPEPVIGGLTADADLQHVINWGTTTSVITHDEALVLTIAYLPDNEHHCGFATAAAKLGLSQAAVRQRCSRIARKLAQAVRTELLVDDTTSGGATLRAA